MFRFARLFRHNDFQLLGRLGFVDEEAGAGRACLVETLALPGDTPVLVAGEPFEAVMAAVHEYQATPAIRSTGSILLTTRPIGRSRSCTASAISARRFAIISTRHLCMATHHRGGC